MMAQAHQGVCTCLSLKPQDTYNNSTAKQDQATPSQCSLSCAPPLSISNSSSSLKLAASYLSPQGIQRFTLALCSLESGMALACRGPICPFTKGSTSWKLTILPFSASMMSVWPT